MVIDADALFDDATAADWLRRASADEPSVKILRQFMAAHRVAAADPYVADADVTRALHIRIGYGSGEQVAAGEGTDMRELPVALPGGARRPGRPRPPDPPPPAPPPPGGA